MKRLLKSESGTVIIALALFLTLLLSFVAFGTEAGRWYLLRAEISKAVDAGALAGAKNLSNPYIDPRLLAQEVCAENFPTGAFGTPGTGTGTASFNVEMNSVGRVDVTGHATSPAIMAQLLGIHDVPVSSAGAAQMRRVEIEMVLDRSGSMGRPGGRPIADLKVAAKSFLDFFTDTESEDKIGLVSFAASVKTERALGTNFIAPMKTAIDRLVAKGYTNPSAALAQAGGPQGLVDQTGVPAGNRVQQFLIFFSDGKPNTFRSTFKYRGVTYDAVASQAGDCNVGDVNRMETQLGRPDIEATLSPAIDPRLTGDGLALGSACPAGGSVSVRWNIFNSRPVPGYGPTACKIKDRTLGDYVCQLAATLAVEQAQALKDRGVIIYAIGLGDGIHSDFLNALATSPEQVYIAPTSAELQAIFQKVAQDIKLRLVS